jgi:hypothetical protein
MFGNETIETVGEEAWIKAHAPQFRLAFVIVGKGDAEIERAVRAMLENDLAATVVDGLDATLTMLEELTETGGRARARVHAVARVVGHEYPDAVHSIIARPEYRWLGN